jgi:hypothetical protein
MDTTKYSAQEIAKRTGVHVCLIHCYSHIENLGQPEHPTTNPGGVKFDTDTFIQFAMDKGSNY